MVDPQDRLQRAVGADYALEGKVGAGGMAVVYRARDLKHDRTVAIKVVEPEIAARVGIERFLREITIAAKLRHPNILPLYDSGDVDGVLFYVMPYIDGPTLGDRLRGEGPLPVEDAIQITQEVAGALSYAHSHGFVHRDIKPDNIMLDAGHAVLADFGIARAVSVAEPDRVTATGTTIGTPGYMSPEQLAGEVDIDGRSDIYSLGCVLYELLAGEAPYTGPSAQSILAKQLKSPVPNVSVVRDTVPPSVESALRKALARTPADRFATASQFAEALVTPTSESTAPTVVSERRRVVTPARVAGAAALLVVVVTGATVLSGEPSVPFDARDWVVIADFANRTGDPVFDQSLNAALGVGIAQSRHVNVLPDARIERTFTLMGREPGPLTGTVAREVALRAGARAVIVPSIDAIDSLYVLTVRIVDPDEGAELRAASERAEGKANVIGAVDDLARQLRRALGESRLAIARLGVELDQATTGSLDALRAWSEGNAFWNAGKYREAGERWERALELDSNFTMAHKALGQYHYFNDDRPRGEVHFRKALSLIDRVTERERLMLEGDIAAARGNRDAQISAYQVYVANYPDDIFAWHNLGNALRFVSRGDEAIAAYERVLAIDSAHASALINIATLHVTAGRREQAVEYYLRAQEIEPNWFVATNINTEFGFTYVALGDLDRARGIFERAVAEGNRPLGVRSLARLEMFRGRMWVAVPHLQEAIRLNRASDTPNAHVSELRNRLYLALAYQLVGAVSERDRELAQVDRIVDQQYLTPGWLVRVAARHARLGAVDRARQIVALMEARADSNNNLDLGALHLARGEVAVADRDWPAAVRELRSGVVLYPDNNFYAGPLARAYYASGDLDNAAAVYRDLLSRQQLGYEAQEYWILGHYDLGRIHEERGDPGEARRFYQRFVDLWRDGDDDIEPLRDARRRLANLSATQSSGSG